jgi:transposase
VCRGREQSADETREETRRRVRDLPILDADTWLIVPRARLRCPRCGPTVEAIAWLDRYARLTARFAERLTPYVPRILAHCDWPLHTSVLEGVNNKIKVIERMAYGFRDDDHCLFPATRID